MTRFLAVAALMLLVGGCSKDVCEEGYERYQDCIQSMSCSNMDPSRAQQCKQLQAQFGLDYSIYLGACREPSTGKPCECEGDFLTTWEQRSTCSMRPEFLCACM